MLTVRQDRRQTVTLDVAALLGGARGAVRYARPHV
jgi:hypothetical protein